MGSLDIVLGDSGAVVAVREQIGRLLRSAGGPARRLPPILVLGETGTGKGLLASTIHRSGPRASGPFVDLNCSAIPETLLEAELFGYERGAFTDARQAKAGLFQSASGGTMFLDEVGLLPLAMQAKLLKVLEERSVRRLGSTRPEAIDVSVIAATSEDLPDAVRAGRFRADLFHRLAVVTVTLPPLRERGRDVILLAEHFLASVCEEYGLPAKLLTEDAHAALLAYSWPGNVRELANVMERTALLSDEHRLTAVALALPEAPQPAARPRASAATSPVVSATTGDDPDAGERRELQETLEREGWNITRVAARLGVPRNTLRYRVERLGLSAPVERRRGGRPRIQPPPASGVRPTHAGDPAVAASERRRLTFLEARLTSAGPEDDVWPLRRARDSTVEKLQAFGGHIDHVTANGAVAIFGMEPDEDAPRRAAHAAMALQKLAARARRGDPGLPHLTVALHTEAAGLARAGTHLALDAEDHRNAGRALQEALDHARPGTVAATGGAARFLARRFELAPPPGDVGGGLWELHRAAELGRTRFVGREHELRVLAQRFELARAGRGQVVVLVGEPGVGKSRLLHEFRRQLGASATWIEGHALSFGRAMAFHPVIDMLKRVFRIDDGDGEPDVVAKIERGVRRLGADLDELLPFIRYLLSVDPGDPAVLRMDPKVRHGRIVRSTHLLLERGAQHRTHVLVLEDAHWADPATEDWTTRLAEGLGASRALIIVTARPGYRPPFGHLSFHTALALSTLSGGDTLRIAGELLGVAELPPTLQTLIVDKADGNPFFVEELVRSFHELGIVRRDGDHVVVDAGPRRIEVPDTVQEVILARVERLDDAMKQVLKVASVIGRTVPVPLLRALTRRAEDALDADLRALQAAEFLYVTRTFPELEYTFKHALTQDVAYASLKEDQRRLLHAGVVESAEALYAGRLSEQVERLAHHAFRGELWRRAATYSRQAGMKAFDHSANREAVASLEQALAALAHLPEDRERLEEAIDIRLVLRSALLQLGEIRRMTECVREAETLALAANDQTRLAWVWTYMTICHLFGGAPNDAVALGERALALAEDVGDVALRATARTPWAHAYREVGQYGRAIQILRATIQALRGDLVRQRLGQGMPPSLYARNVAAICLAELGDFGEAVALGSESVEIAEALDNPFGAVLARIALGHTYLVQDRVSDAVTVLDAALGLIDSRDIPAWFPWAAAARGYARALAGEATEGVALLQRAIDRAAVLRFFFGHSQWVSWLAHAHALAGNFTEAHRRGEDALRSSRERGERGYEAWILHVLGEIARLTHAAGAGERMAIADAETHQRAALELAAELGMRPLVARCERALAAVAAVRGDVGEAGERKRRAASLFAALGMPDVDR